MNHTEFLWRRLPYITGAVLLLLSITTIASALTTEQLAEKALAATVYLEMKDSTGTTLSFGSGFFVKPNQIATNFHVIEGARQGTAKLVSKYTRYQIEGIVATDKDNDLAVLKVTASGVAPLSLGDSDTVNIGAKIYVAGNPKGLEGTFSDGLISRRESYPKKRLQMTAPISPGSSGGPVLNSNGKVIGISVSVHRALDAQNLNFAIPSNTLKALLAKGQPARPLSQSSQSISGETYFLRGNAKYELGLYNAAIVDYTQVIRLEPDGAAAYYNRGNAKYNLKQYFAAISDFDTAIRLKPDDALAYLNRGNAKYNLKQYFAAISDYDMAIRLKPDDTVAYYNRGNVKYDLKQYFAAIADYDTAIRLDPDYALAYVNRGVAKYNLKQYFAAIADYDTAIRYKPDYALAYVKRGLAKAALEQRFAAISDYDTAIRLKPDYAGAYYARGLAKALLGRTREAKQDLWTAWDLAVQAGDTDLKADIERALRVLE